MENSHANGFFNSVISSFGPTERILFYLFAAVLFFSGLSAAWQANNFFLVEVPGHGGKLTEGMVGSPRFVNPLLAISETDKSLSTLVYSGLLKYSGDTYVADLAEYYSISQDGLNYDIKIRDDAFFHDGKPVTATDIAFTIEKALDPLLKSPRRSNWEGVTVEVVDEKNLRFILRKPYYSFLENLTQGVLPKHVWEDATSEELPFSQLNIEPVGSGPYEASDIKYNSSGVPTVVTLSSFKKYTGEEPFIKTVEIRFFQSEEALVKAYESGSIDSVAGLSPEVAIILKEKGFNIASYVMPRVFGVFFNQNQAGVFLNPEVRKALDISIDKEKLVKEVLKGYGLPLKGPIPAKESRWIVDSDNDFEEAKAVLEKAGWKANEDGILEKKVKSVNQRLSFSISTSDAPELKATADILASSWEQLGADVEIKVFESGDLNQNVIKPRKYDALLFGESFGRDLDFYPFWHSSARNDPGLNIALYANITTDKLLEEMRTATDIGTINKKRAEFESEIINDIPAIFTYAPDFIYAIHQRIKNVDLDNISSGSSRFMGIEKWYIETEKVWSVFSN